MTAVSSFMRSRMDSSTALKLFSLGLRLQGVGDAQKPARLGMQAQVYHGLASTNGV